MNTREISELLKGCRPIKDADGNIIVQSILNMQIVCLTTDDEYSMDNRFANPLTALVASNHSYGEISFTNKDNKEVIIPTQMAVITNQTAQNHAMIKAGYISPNKTVTFTDAACVQGSQTGHINNSQEYRMIPVSIREMAYDTVGAPHNHGRLYPAVEKLVRMTNTATDPYIDKYFTKYDKTLEQFIAHFERPNKLIGIIVLIDGEVIAIDKFPSFTYAEQVWDMMIRDCYGSLAIMSQLKNKTSNNIFTETYNSYLNPTTGLDVIVKLKLINNIVKKNITNGVHDKIQDILDMTFNTTEDNEASYLAQTESSIKSYILKNDGYIGQVLCESELNHLVSIVKKETFDPNALRVINEIRNKARRQERFRL
jgi:hypothetical protein